MRRFIESITRFMQNHGTVYLQWSVPEAEPSKADFRHSAPGGAWQAMLRSRKTCCMCRSSLANTPRLVSSELTIGFEVPKHFDWVSGLDAMVTGLACSILAAMNGRNAAYIMACHESTPRTRTENCSQTGQPLQPYA